MKQSTWVTLLRNDELLLTLKKRGFGIGKWNGAGGKVEEGETIEQAAVREFQEEVGVSIKTADLEKCAILQFSSTHDPKLNWVVHVFTAREWQGDPRETEEVEPAWFKTTSIPYEKMWADDVYWLPKVLSGEKITGEFRFDATGNSFEHFSIQEVSSLPH